MKILLLFIIPLLLFCSKALSQQCPPSILKIQSPMCDTPRNLAVNDINCTAAKLTWKGNKNQQYIVQITGTDATANTVFETKAADYAINENGNCTAAIAIKEGEKINWNVQAICNINGVIIYSPVVEARETIIPSCLPVASQAKDDVNADATAMRLFPNPTTGSLTVAYYSRSSNKIQLSVFDMNGRRLFKQNANALAKTNSYSLNLNNLLPGNYMLEVSNGAISSRASFIILKN